MFFLFFILFNLYSDILYFVILVYNKFQILDWASIATISTLSEIQTYPFVSLKSVSDGPRDNSTGMLYFYITSMDVSGKDISVRMYH